MRVPASGVESKLRVFAHLSAEKASLYRTVMNVFGEAKARFVLHLRTPEVLAELAAGPAPLDPEDLDPVIEQLCAWGNIEAIPDTADVRTVEEFYRPRFLYRLTREGEAAERAFLVFLEEVEEPGELQAVALGDIVELMRELRGLEASDAIDPARAHRVLRSLSQRFVELASKAQTFVGGLQRTIDFEGAGLEGFRVYKDRLIDYLERFIGQLVLSTTEISQLLEELDEGVDALLVAAANRELEDALDPDDDARRAAADGWRRTWQGLRSWFIGEAGRPSQAEVLRARARAAIPELLAAADALNERRTSRSDRSTDLRTLARWFATAGGEGERNRLWRAAFGLAPSRHLAIDAASIDARESAPVSAKTSWHEAPPLEITPRLRRTGRYRRRGRSNSVADLTAAKAALAERAAREAEQIAAVRARLASGGRRRLSQLGVLDRASFDCFLDLLGEALASGGGDEVVQATSIDGSLVLVLEPADSGEATIETADGTLRGRDRYLEIRDQTSPAARPAEALVEEGVA